MKSRISPPGRPNIRSTPASRSVAARTSAQVDISPGQSVADRDRVDPPMWIVSGRAKEARSAVLLGYSAADTVVGAGSLDARAARCRPFKVSRRLRCERPPIECLRLLQQHDAVRVGPFAVVRHAPAVGRLGELLGIDQDQSWIEAGAHGARNHDFLELDGSADDFTDFERDES